MTVEKVLYETRGPAAVITLNRPAVLNALDAEALALLRAHLLRFEADPALRAAILTGAGGRAFSAGADLRNTEAFGAPDAPVQVTEEPDNYEITKPLIAAIDGYCVAAGLEHALRCDIRIATPRSSFGLPEPRWSLLAGYGLHYLSRLIPPGEALYMQLTGERIDAEQALRCGLVHELVPPERLLPRAEEIAGKIAECAPLAVEAIKRTVYFNLRRGVEDSYRFVRPLAEAVGRSEDARFGAGAFAEKRKPQWKGR
jgi:enoyl-CoA hydratase/carnithine racemase